MITKLNKPIRKGSEVWKKYSNHMLVNSEARVTNKLTQTNRKGGRFDAFSSA